VVGCAAGSFLIGCRNETAVPTKSPSVAPSITGPSTISPSLPASTSAARHSSTATASPFPTLSENGPYLMFGSIREENALFLYDADGSGKAVLRIPQEGNIHRIGIGLGELLSPDGKYLAYYSGDYLSFDNPDELPITLSLFNIHDGTAVKIADVAGPDYRQKLYRLADQLKESNPDGYSVTGGEEDWVAADLISVFTTSLFTLSWAPDGSALAFAAQIDGNSSDVYVYDVGSGAIRRVEESLHSVYEIRWSPDGKHIVYENAIPYRWGVAYFLYVIQAGAPPVSNPNAVFEVTEFLAGEWLSPTSLLLFNWMKGHGLWNVYALNILTGDAKRLWDGSVFNYAIDPENRLIALCTSNFGRIEQIGFFIIAFTGKAEKIFEGIYWLQVFYRGGNKHRFLVQGVGGIEAMGQYPIQNDVVGIALEGTPKKLGKFSSTQISISPDHMYLLLFDEKKLFLYDARDELIRSIPMKDVRKVVWRPDSQAFFFTNERELYFMPAPDGEPELVETCVQFDCVLDDAVWVSSI
jgi:hypothetical protein